MDMREMVDKVKKGEPLYGRSSLSEHMQGVAARNSRYTGLFLYAVPWFNFVNHPYVCLPLYFFPGLGPPRQPSAFSKYWAGHANIHSLARR